MSAYLSRRGLERVHEHLSERDLSVIYSVQEHRFLTTRHIEELHFADHASAEAAARIARRVLARLTRDRLLARLKRRVGGVRAGSASYVYALGPVGRRLVADARRFTEPSPLFLDHTLALADARTMLVRAHRKGELDLVGIEVEPACWRRYTGPGGASGLVRPDLYVVTRHGDFEDCWFLEIDRGTESPAAIGRKCRVYEAYWRTGREEEAHGAFPLVVWVAQDGARAQRIEKVISSARSLKRELFRVTTTDRLVKLLAGGTA
jgi:hypothetical protein